MFRPASRSLLIRSSSLRHASRAQAPFSRRFLNTAPPHKTSRSWKGTALRWGLAGAAVYYYNTSNIFAEQPSLLHHQPPQAQQETDTLPTLDSYAQRKQKQKPELQQERDATTHPLSAPLAEQSSPTTAAGSLDPTGTGSSPAQLEEEADAQGAFNPETGEINWDCPCLGGMAHGPCGEEFKSAFSCFIYSNEEPKGVDCIEKFKGMQDCFRRYPDIYGAELEDEEDTEDQELNAATAAEGSPISPQDGEAPRTPPSAGHTDPEKVYAGKIVPPAPDHEVASKREQAKSATEQVKREHEPLSESEELVPKSWHDTTSSNEGK